MHSDELGFGGQFKVSIGEIRASEAIKVRLELMKIASNIVVINKTKMKQCGKFALKTGDGLASVRAEVCMESEQAWKTPTLKLDVT